MPKKLRYKIVVIGGSLGGVNAMEAVLESLSREFPIPIAIVLHRTKDSDETLISIFQKYTALMVREVEDKDEINPGYCYIAPANYHLLIDEDHFALSTDAPVNNARPSIDVFFESAASAFREGVIGVILTGASNDGTQGLAMIKTEGGLTVVQDPKTTVSRVMPEAAIAATSVDKVLPIYKIGPFLNKLCCP